MKVETLLDAIEDSWEDILWFSQCDHEKYIQRVDRRKRQRKAFRARILRVVDELREYEALHHIRMGNFIERDWNTPEEDEAWKDL